MKANKRIIEGLTLCTLLVSGSTLVQAEQSDEWSFFVGGYLTATSIDADTTVGTPLGDQSLHVDAKFKDLLKNLSYGGSGRFIARKGKLSLNVDLLFVGLDIDQSVPIPPPYGPGNVHIDVDIMEHEFFAGYQAFEQYKDLEVLAGVRYINQSISIKLPTQTVDKGDNWFDPFVGLRYLGPINQNWNWILRGDIGGFGVGSHFAWHVDAGVGYKLNDRWSAGMWYKILDIDYTSGNSGDVDRYKWDGREEGITLGIGYHF